MYWPCHGHAAVHEKRKSQYISSHALTVASHHTRQTCARVARGAMSYHVCSYKPLPMPLQVIPHIAKRSPQFHSSVEVQHTAELLHRQLDNAGLQETNTLSGQRNGVDLV